MKTEGRVFYHNNKSKLPSGVDTPGLCVVAEPPPPSERGKTALLTAQFAPPSPRGPRDPIQVKAVGTPEQRPQSKKRLSEVDIPGLSIYHPTKLYTSTIKQTHQAGKNHQAPKAFFGSLARLRPHTTGQPRNALKRIPQGLVGSSFSKRTSIVRLEANACEL